MKEREKGKGIAEQGFVFGDALIERVKITVPRLVTGFRGDVGKRGRFPAVIRVKGILKSLEKGRVFRVSETRLDAGLVERLRRGGGHDGDFLG